VFLFSQHRKLFPSGERFVEADSLTFPAVTRHHSGVYICAADNGFGGENGNPIETEIKLDVQRKLKMSYFALLSFCIQILRRWSKSKRSFTLANTIKPRSFALCTPAPRPKSNG